VIVTPLAVDQRMVDEQVVVALRAQRNLHKPYVLFVGAMFGEDGIYRRAAGWLSARGEQFPAAAACQVNRYSPQFPVYQPHPITSGG